MEHQHSIAIRGSPCSTENQARSPLSCGSSIIFSAFSPEISLCSLRRPPSDQLLELV